jgi:hypothetical protein
MAADDSLVLRDMFDPSSDAKRSITLCDPELETAIIIRAFFHLIVSGDLEPMRAEAQDRTDLFHFAAFLKKWDCPSLQKAYLNDMCANVRGHTLATFIAGAALNCPKTCGVATDAPMSRWRHGRSKSIQWSDEAGAHRLDPAHWPLIVVQFVPVTYHWALQRAFNRKARWAATSRGGFSLSIAFKEYLAIAQGKTGEKQWVTRYAGG